MFTNVKNYFTSRVNDKCVGKGGSVTSAGCRGVVVRERGGTRRSGKYFGAGTALRQIGLSLATGGTLTPVIYLLTK